MPLQNTSEKELQEAGGDNPAPQSGNYPVGCTHEAPIPVGVELLAQVLLHQAGSAELAKKAVEGAAHRESIPDFREDLFGRRFGFATRGELLAASTPVIAADGTQWWTTTIPDNRWIVWNQEDMSATQAYATLQDARRSVYLPRSGASPV